jgi:hypothetical protein
MGMRKDWDTAKGAAQLAFKNATGKMQLEALAKNEAPPTWPFKFDKNLGPTLDKYESAKKANKAADVKKHAEDAKKVLAQYMTLVRNKTSDLNKLDQRICTVLLTELQKIWNVVSK